MTKAPCGGEKADPSPVDRRKGGLKRSTASYGYGIPLGLVCAGANRHDSPLLAPTLAAALAQVGLMPGDVTAHLEAAYDSAPTRELFTGLGFEPDIARKGVPGPVQAGGRWVIEQTNSWMNGYGKLRRMTDATARSSTSTSTSTSPPPWSRSVSSSSEPATATGGTLAGRDGWLQTCVVGRLRGDR